MSCLVFPKATVQAAGRRGSSLHYAELSCCFSVQPKWSSKKSCWCRKNKINVEKTRTHQSVQIFTGSTCAFPSSLKPDPAEECLCVRGRPRGKRRPSTKKTRLRGGSVCCFRTPHKTKELPPTQSEGDTSRHGNLHLHQELQLKESFKWISFISLFISVDSINTVTLRNRDHVVFHVRGRTFPCKSTNSWGLTEILINLVPLQYPTCILHPKTNTFL